MPVKIRRDKKQFKAKGGTKHITDHFEAKNRCTLEHVRNTWQLLIAETGGGGGGAFVFGSLRRQRRPTPASTTVHDSYAWRSRWVWVIVPGLGFGWGVGVPRKAETKWTAGCTCSTKTSGLRAVPLAVSVPSLFLWLPEYQQRIVIP